MVNQGYSCKDKLYINRRGKRGKLYPPSIYTSQNYIPQHIHHLKLYPPSICTTQNYILPAYTPPKAISYQHIHHLKHYLPSICTTEFISLAHLGPGPVQPNIEESWPKTHQQYPPSLCTIKMGSTGRPWHQYLLRNWEILLIPKGYIQQYSDPDIYRICICIYVICVFMCMFINYYFYTNGVLVTYMINEYNFLPTNIILILTYYFHQNEICFSRHFITND